MKVANLVLAAMLAAVTGCASGRPYSPGSTGGSSGPLTPIPDTTPSLGSPAEDTSGSSSSLFRGNGPTLKMPEAFRDDPPMRSPRLSSRWNSTAPRSQTSQYGPSQKNQGAATSPVSSSDQMSLANEPNWSRFYRSTDRRAIESIQMGSGPQRIAIVASMHGDETQSVALVEELARYLGEHRDALGQATVLLVKTLNPDGFAARSPYNVHGVDLNRNFPSANWKSLSNTRAGAKAGSEAETRVAMRLLGDFRPTLLIHLKDSRDLPVVNSEGNVGDRAERVARLAQGKAVAGLGAKTSGSIEHYAATQLKCPSLTLLLSVEASDQAAWAKNRDLLLAACGRAPAVELETGARDEQTHPFDQGAVRNSSLRQQRPSSIDVTGRSPAKSRSKLPDFPAAVPEHGYLELPAP